MKHISSRLLSIAVGIALLPTSAQAEKTRVHGDQFMSMVQGNTVSATNAAGAAFNIYFLPGGDVSYKDDAGVSDKGKWRLDNDGDVCVVWENVAEATERCFRVWADGNKVSWEGKSGSGSGQLRGGVTDTFVKQGQ